MARVRREAGESRRPGGTVWQMRVRRRPTPEEVRAPGTQRAGLMGGASRALRKSACFSASPLSLSHGLTDIHTEKDTHDSQKHLHTDTHLTETQTHTDS